MLFVFLASCRALPVDFCVHPLTESDLPLIASKWPFLPPDITLMKFSKCLEIGESVGVYKKMDSGEEQLVSWVVQHEYGTIGHLYTLENSRHQGFALVVVYDLSKKLRAKGMTPIAEVLEDNWPAHALFQKLGFKCHEEPSIFLGNFDYVK